MSIILPHYLWLATGGLCNLSVEKIWPIRGRDIRLYPDLGCYDKWLIKAKEISLKTGCRIAVDATLENNNEKCNLKDGDDIVDWFRV